MTKPDLTRRTSAVSSGTGLNEVRGRPVEVDSCRGGALSDPVDALNWLLAPPPVGGTPGGTVWHYTDLDGLLGILESQSLWASSARLLNDSSEIQHGIELIQRTFELLRPSLGAAAEDIGNILRLSREATLAGETFVLSASSQPDSLSQWRAYSGDAGYAVGIDRGVPLDLLQRKESDCADLVARRFNCQPREDEAEVSPWRDVLYTEVAQEEVAEAYVRVLRARVNAAGASPASARPSFASLLTTAYGATAYATIVSSIKNLGFADEREVRLVATATATEKFWWMRPGGYGPTPYVKLTGHISTPMVGRPTYQSRSANPLPIKHVMIGPSPNARAAEAGLRTALELYGYESVEVLRSAIPYR